MLDTMINTWLIRPSQYELTEQGKKMQQATFSTEEAADYLKSSVATLEYWRQKNTGPKYYKPSHKIIYYKTDLDDWIRKNG